MKKGIFFTLDSVFGLLILLTLYGVFAIVSIETVSAEIMYEDLHAYSEDMIDVMSKMRLWDIRHEPIVHEVCNTSAFDITDINKTVLDAVGALWATNETANTNLASRLLETIFENTTPNNLHWAVQVGRTSGYEIVYNTTELLSGRHMSAVSRRLVSGYMKGKPTVGFTTRAFLTNILGKGDAEYVFFGGFVGQGNISVYLRDIPTDAQIYELYLELSLGDDFDLYVNGTPCGSYTKSPGNYSVDNWTITDAACLGNITRGGSTRIDINFTNGNASRAYIGGGFIRVKLTSSEFSPPQTTIHRYYFPGIDGLINLYDSFFVPGNITSISGRLHFLSNYSLFLGMGSNGSITVNGTGVEQVVPLENANFSALNYENISLVTVPIRLGMPSITLAIDASAGDIMLVTDVSGSMEWCADQTQACCSTACPAGDNCSCGAATQSCGQENRSFTYAPNGQDYCGYKWFSECVPPNEKKIEIAVNASNEFLNIMFTNPNNRVGIVEYSGPGLATSLSPDLWIPVPTFDPRGIILDPESSIPGLNTTYNITANIHNNGWNVVDPFNVSFYNGSFDPGNASGRLIGWVELPGLASLTWANVSINWTATLFDNVIIMAYADPENNIWEFDEANNNKTIQIDVARPNTDIDFVSSYAVSRSGYPGGYATSWPICRNFTNMTYNFTLREEEGIDVGLVEIRAYINYTLSNGTAVEHLVDYYNTTLLSVETKTLTFVLDADFVDSILEDLEWNSSQNAYFYVTSDPMDYIDESSESDNTGYTAMSPRLPNLEFGYFYLSPNSLCNATPTDITIEMYVDRHYECRVFDPFVISVYKDFVDPTNASGNLVGTVNISYVNESNGTYFSDWVGDITYEGNLTNDTTFIGWIDYPPVPDGVVMEFDEADNYAEDTVVVVTYPDLVVAGMQMWGSCYGGADPPYECFWSSGHGIESNYVEGVCFGEEICFRVLTWIYNLGCPTTQDFNYTIYSTPYWSSGPLTVEDNYTINGMDANEFQYFAFDVNATFTENTRLIPWIDHPPDPNGVVVEADESNNNDSIVLQERRRNLNVTNLHTTLPGPADEYYRPYLNPPDEFLFTCRIPGNYGLNMNITNDGPCHIWDDFNASFNFKYLWYDYTHELYRQVINGLNRGATVELTYDWDGIMPNGNHISTVGDYGAYVYGYADYSPNSTGNIDYPPTGEGAIWELREADNLFESTYEYKTADITLANMGARELSEDLYEITATIRNIDNICDTTGPFNVSFFNPFTGSVDLINKTNISHILQPGDEVDVSVTWSKDLNPGTHWVYGVANWIASMGGGPGDYFSPGEYDAWEGGYEWPTDWDNTNRTNITVSSGGSGAPFIYHILQLLLSGKEPAEEAVVTKKEATGGVVITDFKVSPSQAVCGSHGKFVLYATVENTADKPYGGMVQFHVRADSIGSVHLPTLKPGERTQVNLKWNGILYEDTMFTASTAISSRSFLVLDPPCPTDIWRTLYDESIVRAHPLSDNITDLGTFVNDSETWYETCICCGIINATDELVDNGNLASMWSIVVMSDGIANVGCLGLTPNMTGDPLQDTIQAACDAHDLYGISVYTVGFGADVDADTLNQTAQCGGGEYFDARNTTELVDAYRAIASTLLNMTYTNQVLEATGANRTTLYPDSYLEFNYEPKRDPAGYRDLVVTLESENFSSCNGEFSVPIGLIPFDVKITSYSADRWTNKVTLNNGSGQWTVFNLSWFSDNYSRLGDPYVIEFDPTTPLPPGAGYPGILAVGPPNRVNVSTGERAGEYSTECPNRNRAIYKALVKGSVPFSTVLPGMWGRNVTVYYDLRHDDGFVLNPNHPPEGVVYIPIGLDMPGVEFNATAVEMSVLEAERDQNALADAFVRLMDQLNFYKLNAVGCTILDIFSEETPVCCHDQPSGVRCNPIDVMLTSDIVMRSVAINEVPYMYGPVDIGVVTWIR
ncbi:MAG: CARDB domain-containing protein [Candidatus Micrarchaeota archaeon]